MCGFKATIHFKLAAVEFRGMKKACATGENCLFLELVLPLPLQMAQ